MAYINVSEYR